MYACLLRICIGVENKPSVCVVDKNLMCNEVILQNFVSNIYISDIKSTKINKIFFFMKSTYFTGNIYALEGLLSIDLGICYRIGEKFQNQSRVLFFSPDFDVPYL